MAQPRVRLPRGRQFAMTWSIPESYGGMTNAMLHRSRALVRLGGAEVDVLTFDPGLDTDEVQRRLIASGELIDGMRLLGVYDWYRARPIHADAGGSLDLGRHPFSPVDEATEVQRRMRVRADADGTVLQVDHLRTDGTVVVSDRRDLDERGVIGGRAVVLCDATGAPVRSWGSLWGLYRFWLDELRRREPSFFIIDSKAMAPFAASYRRKRAVMMHLVHGSHVTGTDPSGPLRSTRRAVFEHPEEFDAVVLLTERQRVDVAARFGARSNLVVVPNSRDLPASRIALHREPGAGIALASLTARKRVDHTVRAVATAAHRVPGIRLDVFGEGEERSALESLIAQSGAPVTLRGHQADARARFADASFVLLTADSEGFPLVLVEAMAAGCIPIAYDMPYGPADIVEHGRSGLLVPSGDVEALASAIETFVTMPPRRIARMREAARRAAERFSDLEVTKAWAGEQRAAERRKLAAWPTS